MPTVVVGIDNGDASTRAVDFAIQRCKAESVDLVLVHVIHWSPFSFNTPAENDERHRRREEELQAADEQVVQPMQKIVTEAGLTPNAVVRHGNPADTLIEIAKEKDAIRIVVGRTGDSGFREQIFGSVASRLVQRAPIPVTVVP
ncbi:universal stress protein [Nostocoides sp.]|uniref:universal stress protein n=1 Tax=Nostocoides sp. TaxID=1917966 RepID=UPI003BAFC998